MIGILCALAIEARCLPKTSRANHILFQTTGVGAKRAKLGAEQLVAKGATALMSWGTAGGLSPTLKVGQLIIPDCIVDQKAQVFWTDSHWKSQISQTLNHRLKIHDGALLQTHQMIASINAKQALFIQYKTAAVDMESAAIAEVAQKAGLPFVAIRAVVDSASMSLPFWLPRTLNADHQIQPLKFAWQFCHHPHTWPSLLHLYRGFAMAKKTLSLAAKMFFNKDLIDLDSGQEV
jgi:adenosylhomocysteine nucleosidase